MCMPSKYSNDGIDNVDFIQRVQKAALETVKKAHLMTGNLTIATKKVWNNDTAC
jgi:hypothetical protein